jgi:hypothetical protein
MSTRRKWYVSSSTAPSFLQQIHYLVSEPMYRIRPSLY